MRTVRRPLLALLPFLFLATSSAPALAQDRPRITPTEHPFLWVIEGGEKPSYLYGTIHLPDDRVLALPKSVQDAIAASDALYCELPMDMGTQMGMMRHTQLPAGQTLKKLLPEDLYQRTEAYLKAKGMSLAPFNRMKVWVLTMQLPMLDYLPQMMMKQPLDTVIYNRAAGAGKEVGGLETVEEQLNVFDSLTVEEQVEQLRQTLDQLDEQASAGGPSQIEQMVLNYLAGDEVALAREALEQMDTDDPTGAKFWKLIGPDRNVRMADRIEAKLKQNPGRSYFFAVGVMHYPNEDGILALLRAKGFTVRRVGATLDARPAPAEPAQPATPGTDRRWF